MVQLQAVTLAAKLLVLSAPTILHYNATSTPQRGQTPDISLKGARTIALLAQYIFAQAAASTTFYDVRDRARTLGALVRGVNVDVYRASVASAASLSVASASNALSHIGNGDGGYERIEVSADDWDRHVRVHAHHTSSVNLDGTSTTWGEGDDCGDDDDDNTATGGVTLRVEQLRVVLFEGKTIGNWEASVSSKELGRLPCFQSDSVWKDNFVPSTGAAASYPLGTMGNLVGRSLFGAEDRVLMFSGDSDGTDPSLRNSPVRAVMSYS